MTLSAYARKKITNVALHMFLYGEKENAEISAGILLRDDSLEGIRSAAREVLNNKRYKTAAAECSTDFRACPGAAGAAEFIENAQHSLK